MSIFRYGLEKLSFRNKETICGTDLFYRAFYGFVQAKFPDGGLVLSMSQFSILPQLPPKIMLDSKVVKIDLQNNHLALLI